MEVIPAVDVLDGRVVRLRRGDYTDVTGFGNDPAAAVEDFAEQGASLVHVVDLAAARSGRASPGLWTQIGSTGVPFQAAGGIRDRQRAAQALQAGAARVVAGTTVVWDDDGLQYLLAEAGDRLVAAVDIRDGRAFGAGWTDAGRDLDEVLDRLAGAGVPRLMVTSVATDGMLTGPDLTLIGGVIEKMDAPVIASGGVSSPADLPPLRGLGAEAVVIGRALFEGRLSLAEAIAAAA